MPNCGSPKRSSPGASSAVSPNGARSFPANSPLSDVTKRERDLARVVDRGVEDLVGRAPDALVQGLVVSRVSRDRRKQQLRRRDEPEQREPGRDEAHAAVAGLAVGTERDDQPENDHDERDVLLEGHRDDGPPREPCPRTPRRAQVRAEQRRDGDRLGVEQLPPEELECRVQEPRRAERGGGPGRERTMAREEVERHRSEREHRDLHDVQEVGTGPEPGGGREQIEPERGVVAEDREPAHGDEVVAAREEPHGLVVDAHVEVDGPEPVLASDDEDGERDDPDGDEHAERDRGRMGPRQPTAAAVRRFRRRGRRHAAQPRRRSPTDRGGDGRRRVRR